MLLQMSDRKLKNKPKQHDLKKEFASHRYALLLHNDDHNLFDFVVDSLVEVCGHDSIQAEQCATIAHYKGKCCVKNGEFEVLSPMKEQLNTKGLSATIEID